MKTVNYRGVLVVFQIPEHWVEENDPEGGGTYYDPDDASITLRLNVTTLAAPRDIGPDEAVAVIKRCGIPIEGNVEMLPNGQAFAVGQVDHATERDTAIELHPLLMVRAVPPRTIRIANFVITAVPSESHAAIIEPKLDAVCEWVRASIISDASAQKSEPWWKRVLGR